MEAYKKNMFALLGKPEYERMKDALEARLLFRLLRAEHELTRQEILKRPSGTKQ